MQSVACVETGKPGRPPKVQPVLTDGIPVKRGRGRGRPPKNAVREMQLSADSGEQPASPDTVGVRVFLIVKS